MTTAAKLDVDTLRRDYAAFRAYCAADRHVYRRLCPVVEWYGQRYILPSGLTLAPYQNVDVIPLPENAALFTNTWPEQPGWPRRYALLTEPDEGHPSVLLENGIEAWVRYAVLPVRMSPGTADDHRRLQRQLMDDLEHNIDSGGSLLP